MDTLLSILISDDIDKMKELLANRELEIINYKFPGDSKSIHMAQSREMVHLLIGDGADPEARDISGLTPLFYWCMDGNIDLIRYAIDELGVDVNAVDNDGKDCLIYSDDFFADQIREIIEAARK